VLLMFIFVVVYIIMYMTRYCLENTVSRG